MGAPSFQAVPSKISVVFSGLPSVEEVFSIGINRAVVLLAEKKAGTGKGRFQRAAPTVLKELGEHPSEGGKVQVLSGRYGPYVKHGDVNATLPRSKDPAALNMNEAIALIAERIAKGPSKPKGRRARTSKTTSKTAKPATAADPLQNPAKKNPAKKPAGKPAKKAATSKAKKASGTREAAE